MTNQPAQVDQFLADIERVLYGADPVENRTLRTALLTLRQKLETNPTEAVLQDIIHVLEASA